MLLGTQKIFLKKKEKGEKWIPIDQKVLETGRWKSKAS
jgi:hypothetical protein